MSRRVAGTRAISFLAATFLQVVVLFITAWGGLRLGAAWRGAAWLQALPLDVPWLYLAVSGAAWLVAGLMTWMMLLTSHRWAAAATAATVTLFSAFWWLDRYVLAQNAVFRQNERFALVLTAVIVVAVLVLTSPPIWNSLFGADDE